jgi:hypothetical protein
MKNKKMALWIALIVTAIIPVYAQQYDSEKDFQVDWDDGGGVKIIKYIGAKKEVSIPPSIQNNPVTGIGGFNDNKNITKVTIPNGVKNIGNSAFSDCASLISITIPNSVTTIGGGAFKTCTSLANITIPNSVTSIGNSAFEDCTKLTSITIPNSVASIGDYAFKRCTNLTGITIPNSVTSIGNNAFADCISLTGITIPDSVTNMGGGVFFNCSKLAKVIIGNGVKSIDIFNEFGGSVRGWRNYGFFEKCISLTSITIPNNVTKIGDRAFAGCTSLTSVNIPDSVTGIASQIFAGCTSLTSITIPNSITAIGNGVFLNNAFADCTGLTSVTFEGILDFFTDSSGFPGDLREKYLASDGGPGVYNRFAGGSTWKKTQSITPPPKPAAAAPAAAASAVSGTLHYTIYDGKEVAVSAGTVNQGAVVIPATYNNLPVTRIKMDGFKGSSVTAITIPNSVTKIHDCAFDDCTSLTSVTFQGTITSANFSSFFTFPGDLRAKYLKGGPGTYTRPDGKSKTWTKQ